MLSPKHLSELSLLLSSFTFIQALVLDTPSPADGFNALITNGSATVSWTSESGDPDRISIEIQNTVTLDSFEFARNVPVSDGSAQGILQDVPGSPHYYLQAVAVGNILDVLANSSTFTVNGLVPSTTDSALVPTSTSASSVSSTMSSSATSSSPEPRSSTPTGAIVGGTIGGVAVIVVLVLFVLLLLRRRKRRNPENKKFLVDKLSDEDHVGALESPSLPQTETSPTSPTPYPLTIPNTYPIQSTPKKETFAQEQQERREKLDLLNSRQEKMMQQWADLRSQNGTSLPPSNGPSSALVEGSESTNTSQAVSETSSSLDPAIQRRLNEMSQRIEALEVEREQLTRELQESVPPPGYAE